MNPALVESFVILITFGAVTCHTGDTVKCDGVFLFYYGHEPVPLRSALSCSGIEFFDYDSLGIKLSDVGNLSGNSLVLGRYTAVGINHNIMFLSVLKQTKVSFDAIIMPCIC